MTLLLNRELVSRVKLCVVSVFPDIVKDCPKMRNLPNIFLRSFKNVGPEFNVDRKAACGHCGELTLAYASRNQNIKKETKTNKCQRSAESSSSSCVASITRGA